MSLNRSSFYILLAVLCALCAFLASCTKLVGWGVLLWSSDNPAVPSGTVLPVYIRSNINQAWVAGVPKEYRAGGGPNAPDKFEIPLKQMELFGTKAAALRRAEEFTQLAVMYGETLQDGLPLREGPDNNARRVYRLRQGEVVKLLAKIEGTPAISSTGEPLPGDWYQTLTQDGTIGYCFSYRLRLFEYSGGKLEIVQQMVEEQSEDADLTATLAKTWLPESYGAMLANNTIDIDMISQHWGFYPGQDSGKARLFLKDVENDRIIDTTFSYTSIQPNGARAWRFDGASLQMQLRSDNVLAVQYTENGGAFRTFLFVTLPTDIDDIILQENARRSGHFMRIYNQGPLFSSANYGSLTLNRNGSFSWSGFDLLIPHIIPASIQGTGKVVMRLYLDSSLENRYAGAFTLQFNGRKDADVDFLYSFESQGLRIEYAPKNCIDGVTVVRRDTSPTIVYFFKGGETPSDDAGEVLIIEE
ncbi:MAG: SH3 domain-containing protein [Treponema sp.]|nr:SH3 domain-containing protein [Treponema sp.]